MKTLIRLSLFTMVILTNEVYAGGGDFAYLYTTDTHPSGESELEQYLTVENTFGVSQKWKLRTEYETGLTDSTQLMVLVDTVSEKNYTKATTTTAFDGAGFELLHRIQSPHTNKHGLAAYLEMHAKPSQQKIETKLLHDIYLFDRSVLWTNNLVGEFKRKLDTRNNTSEKITEVKWLSGVNYSVLPMLKVGFESELKLEKKGAYTLDMTGDSERFIKIGPNISAYGKNFWVSAAIRRAINVSRDYRPASDVRIKVGFPF